jgi:hypothetical protein
LISISSNLDKEPSAIFVPPKGKPAMGEEGGIMSGFWTLVNRSASGISSSPCKSGTGGRTGGGTRAEIDGGSTEDVVCTFFFSAFYHPLRLPISPFGVHLIAMAQHANSFQVTWVKVLVVNQGLLDHSIQIIKVIGNGMFSGLVDRLLDSGGIASLPFDPMSPLSINIAGYTEWMHNSFAYGPSLPRIVFCFDINTPCVGVKIDIGQFT